ncbi:unnamed protein product, partial [Nesidiocoris tenuis]
MLYQLRNCMSGKFGISRMTGNLFSERPEMEAKQLSAMRAVNSIRLPKSHHCVWTPRH